MSREGEQFGLGTAIRREPLLLAPGIPDLMAWVYMGFLAIRAFGWWKFDLLALPVLLLTLLIILLAFELWQVARERA
ncbi:MAG: hypothetical protein BMS9Abin28_2207 [Anaerolineae bacterium]|nr:MAG: hypothetical protein BMS9Abin28_2207 [Anaerolineae bacterium]